MKKAIIAAAVVVGVIGLGGGFLLAWDIPPPTKTVEKVIPNDRFPR